MGNENIAGASLFAYGIFMIIGCLILPYTCESAPRKLVFFFTFVGFGLSCMFIGPSNILGLYDSAWFSSCIPDEV